MRLCGLVGVLLFVGVLGSGCASGSASTARAFSDVRQLTSLERGVATRRDVQRLLGAPDGSGHALLPGDDTPLDLWYYEDVSIADVKQVAGGFHGRVRQQILLVSFRGDAFEGYMWWSNQGGVK